ncbi:dihydropteroate synthase [bacterium]|nr:dihydropteroate synthase [bacterium]
MYAWRWQIKGRKLRFDFPLIVGILNLTPDSFYSQSRCEGRSSALKRAKQLVADGADILDLGAESTRPGAAFVSEEKELARLLPALKAIRAAFPDIPISIDTRRAAVAKEALEAGADIINDVSSLSDPLMKEVAARYLPGVILTHAPAELASGENRDVSIGEVKKFLRERTSQAVAWGVPRDSIVWDPGLGFGKTTQSNWQLLMDLKEISSDNLVMCAASRKRFTRKDPDAPEGPGNSGLEGTIKANLLAVENGAAMLRVHDVAEMKQILKGGSRA